MRRAAGGSRKLSFGIASGTVLIAITAVVSCGGRTTTARDRGLGSGGQSGSLATGGTTVPIDGGGGATGGTTALVGAGGTALGAVGTGGTATNGTTTPTGTGGQATAGATGTPTGETTDAAPPDVDGSPSVPPIDESCSGEPKLGRQGTTVIAPVTAYRMSPAACCVARYGILFHSKDGWGSDIEIAVLQTDSLAPGDHFVADSWLPMRVTASEWRTVPGTPPLTAGTVRTTAALPTSDLFQLGLSVHLLSSDMKTSSTFFCVPSVSIAPDAWARRLQFFVLDDPTFSVTEAAKLPLDSLVLAKDPLLDLGRIASVTRGNGEIRYLGNGDFGQSIRDRMQSQSLLVMPFVVVADGVRIYLGTFVSPISSMIGPGPWVETDGMSADRFRISPAPGDADVRWDPRILGVLRESSRLVE